MEEFKIALGAELKAGELDSIKQQVNNIKTNPIKLNIDTSNITSQLNSIKEQIQNLSNIKITLSGNGGSGISNGIQKTVTDMNYAYKQMLNIQKNIGSLKIKINSLDSIKNSREITELSTQLKALEADYRTIQSTFNQNLSVDQWGKLQAVIDNTENKLSQLAAKAQDTKQKLANGIQAKIDNGTINNQISTIENRMKSLGLSNDEVRTKIESLKTSMTSMTNSTNMEHLIGEYRKYQQTLTNVTNQVNILARQQKLANDTAKLNANKTALSSQMSVWLQRNSAAASKFGSQIRLLQAELKSCDASKLSGIKAQFQEVTRQAQLSGKAALSFSDSLKKKFSALTTYFSATMLITKTIQGIRSMYNNVLEVDTAMTGLYRVTNLTGQQYSTLYDKMVSSAKEYGAALSDIVESTASWVRLGFDANNAERLSEITTMYQHVTDLDNTTAVNNLVTAYKGYQEQLLQLTNGDETAAIELIADIYDRLGNEFAVSAANIGSGLSKAASALQLAGNTIQESAAMLTGITEVTQDPDKAGNSLKVLSLRIRGMKGELQKLGEDVDENVESLSKMQTQVLNLTHGKVNIFNDDGSFKSTYEIMQNIAKVYDDLNDTDKADLLETIAGKNRANDVAALISNWEQVEKATSAATNAEGTAAAENEKYMNSLKGHLDSLIASWQALSNSFLDSGFLKGFVSGLTQLISFLDVMVDKFGALPTLFTGIAAALSFKNIGIFKTIESDATVSGLRITSIFQDAFAAIRSASTGMTLPPEFGASIQADVVALQNFQAAVQSGMSAEEAFATTMSMASTEAQQYAQKMGAAGISTKQFETNQRLAQVSLTAQNKSLVSAKSLITEYNKGCANVGVSQSQFINAVSKSNSGLSKYLSGLNGAKGSLGGYITSLVATKAATIALQAATMALNMAITMGLSAMITGLISLVDNLITTKSELKEKVDEITKSFEEQHSTLMENQSDFDSLSKKYEKLSKGVNALGQNVSLSKEEYQEYQDVVQSIANYVPSLIQGYDDQGIAILNCKGNVEELTKAYNDLIIAENNSLLKNGNDVFKNFKNEYEDALESNFKGNEMTVDANNALKNIINSKDLKKAVDTYAPAGGSIGVQIVQALKDAGLEQKNNSHWYNPFSWDDFESGEDFIVRACKENKEIVEAIVGDFNQQVETDTKDMESIVTAYLSNAFLGDYSNLNGTISNIVTQITSDFDAEFYNQFENVDELYNYLKSILDDFSKLSDDDSKKIQDAFDIQAKFNNNDVSLTEYVASIKNVKKAISGLDEESQNAINVKLGLDTNDVETQYNDLIENLKAKGISDSVAEQFSNALTSKNFQIAQELFADNTLELTDKTLDGLNNVLNAQVQIQDSMSKISFNDLMSDKDFVSQIDNYIDRVGKLQTAMQNFKTGKFTSNDFIELVKEFPELSDNADDLDSAISELLNTMNTDITSEFANQFDNLDTDEDIKALENFEDAVLELGKVVGNTEFSINIETETESMQNLFTAMKESVTSTGLTSQSIANLKARYQDLEKYDASRLFERTTDGIHLNTKALRELESEYEKQRKSEVDGHLEDLVDEYNNLTEKINKASDAASTADLYAQRDDILDQINDTADLAAQYEGLTSAFHKWEEAQSIGEEGDMYDSLAGSLKDIKELYDEGLIGTNKFRTAVQLMSNEDLSTANVDDLLSAYESSYSTMKKYFQEGRDGCLNFLTDIQSLNSEWAKMNQDGSWEINFGLGNDQEIADALGINVESVQAIMRKLSDYGFDINLDSAYSSFDLLKSKAEEANDKLKNLSKTEYTFNFQTDDIDYVNEQIKEAQGLLDTFKNADGTVNVKAKGYEEAQTILTSLISSKQSLSAPEVMSIDTAALSKADSEISNAIVSLQEFVKYSNDLEIKTALGIDTSDTQQKIQNVANNLSGIPEEVKTKLGLDDESFQTAISNIQGTKIDVKAGVILKDGDIESVQTAINGIKAKDIELSSNSNAINKELKGIDEFKIQNKNFTVSIKDNATSKLSEINSYINKIQDKTVTITTKTVTNGNGNDTSTGTGKAQGTAFARGNWGTEESGVALGGELGQELVSCIAR